MPKPLIALTSYPRNEEDRFTLPARYIESIERAQGAAVVVTPVSGKPDDLIKMFDGFILTGGADVDPARYGGQAHETIYGVDRERDEFELELAKAIVENSVLTMAICRGVQILNVALGGTLVEHVPDEYGENVIHRAKDFDKIDHSIKLQTDSNLARMMGKTEFVCASFHHQSIRQPAPGFRVVGEAEDGVIEAIESEQHPEIIAIQWHPEYTAHEDDLQQGLFNSFIKFAKQRGKGPE